MRLPVPGDVHGTWTWLHRPTPTTWAANPVTAAAGDVTLAAPALSDGWLRLTLADGGYDAHPEPVVISSVSMPPRDSITNPVRRIGGQDAQGKPWSLSADEAIALTDSFLFQFRVTTPAGKTAEAFVVQTDPDGSERLALDSADPDVTNYFLSLPECDLDGFT